MDIPKEPSTTFSFIKTLVIEIGIILILSFLVLLTLNYFKVIDIMALVAPQSSTPQVSSSNKAPVTAQPKPSGVVARTQNSPVIQGLQLLARNKALHFAQSITEFEGKINSIDILGGEDSNSKLKYQVRIELSVGTGSATFVAMYPKEAMEKMKILDSNKKVLTIKDLKVGDAITIKTNTGTLRQYPDNFNQVEITRAN